MTVATEPNVRPLASRPRAVPVFAPVPIEMPDAAPRDGDDGPLFCDVFVAENGREVIALAPPLQDLRPALARMRLTALPSAIRCPVRIIDGNGYSLLRIAAPSDTERLVMFSDIGDAVIAPRTNQCAMFAGKRVLLAQSRDHRLDAIQDWVRFHRDSHGADAVLIYHQGSNYLAAALAAALGELAGITAAVVSWPFPRDGGDAALEHARRLYLALASSVMNCGIDECVVPAGAFAAAERAPFGIVRYRGAAMPGIDGVTPLAAGAPMRHRDFDHVARPPASRRWRFLPDLAARAPTRWIVVPARCPDHAQWSAHRIANWLPALAVTEQLSYRHFPELADPTAPRAAFDVARHVRDETLAGCFERVDWGA